MTTPPIRKRVWLAAVLVCILADLALLGEALFTSRVRAPADALVAVAPFALDLDGGGPEIHNPLLSDWSRQFHPWHRYVRAAYGEGRIPLWNDLVGCGHPFAANMQSEAFSPYLPIMLAAGDQYADFKQLAQLLVAQLLCLALARRLGLSAFAALVCALAFSMSSYMQSWSLHPHSGSAAFTPGIVLALLWLREGFTVRRLAAVSLLVGASVLAGHIETAMMAGIGGVLIALFHKAATDHLGRRLRFVLDAALAGAGGLLVAAILVAPFLDYLDQSDVELLRQNQAPVPFPADHLATLFDRDALGAPLDAASWRGASNFIEGVLFVGRITLCLALLGLVGGLLERRRAVLPMFLCGACGIALAYAPPEIFARLKELPVFDRIPLRRMGFLALLPLAFLAGVGLDVLLRRAREVARGTVPLVAAVIIALAGVAAWLHLAAPGGTEVAWWSLAYVGGTGAAALLLVTRGRTDRARPLFALAFVVAIAAEGVLTWRDFVPSVDASWLAPRSRVLEQLEPIAAGGRLLPTGSQLPPETSMLRDVPSIREYDAIHMRRHMNLLHATRAFYGLTWVQSATYCPPAVLDILSTRWLMTPWPAADAPFPAIAIGVTPETPLRFSFTTADAPVEILLHRGPGKTAQDGSVTVRLTAPGLETLTCRVEREDIAFSSDLGRLSSDPDRAVRAMLANIHRSYDARYIRFDPARAGIALTVEIEVAPGHPMVVADQLHRGGLGTALTERFKIGPYHVTERTSALPRVYVAPEVKRVDDMKAALAAVTKKLHDALALTIVEAPEGTSLPGGMLAPVAWESDRPEELRFTVDLEKESTVVVTDAIARGWTAEVDGEEVEMFPANVVGRAIVVPAGKHEVVMRYEPWSYTLGWIVSAMMVLLCLVGILRSAGPRPAGPPAPSPERGAPPRRSASG